MAKRILVIGSLNMDLVARVPHYPQAGETLTSSSFKTSPGGKGANQAVACAKLSRCRVADPQKDLDVQVAMLGAVGDDAYGTTLKNHLEDYHVDTQNVNVVPGTNSGIAVVVVEERTGENRIILSPGANGCATPEMFASIPGPRPDMVILQLEIPLETVEGLIRWARTEGISTLLNPAPAVPLKDEVYRGLDHLVLNETETEILLGLPAGHLQGVAQFTEAATEFVNKGVKNVVITLGSRGVFCLNAEGHTNLMPAEKVSVVDTTGAGDTFIGAYALGVVMQEDFHLDEVISRANRAAALTVQRRGAQDSIPWLDEM